MSDPYAFVGNSYAKIYNNVFRKNDIRGIYFLKTADYNACASPDSFFTAENRPFLNAPIYKTSEGQYFWIHPDSINSIKEFWAELYPVDFTHPGFIHEKILFMLKPNAFAKSQTLEIDTLVTQFGISYRISPLRLRKIKSISAVYQTSEEE